MPMFDPFGIQKTHDSVREAIKEKKPGFAQSFVDDVLVSMERDGHAVHLHSAPNGLMGKRANEVIDEMMLDVATGEGGADASPGAFLQQQADYLIWNFSIGSQKMWPGRHMKAAALKKLVSDRPDLFV